MSTSPYPYDAVPPPAGAMLQVYRKPSIAGVTAAFNIKLDGTDLGRVKPGEAVRYPIAPGKHRLQVVIWGNMGSKAALFTAHPGETVYFTSTAPLMAVLHPIELVQDDGSPAAAAALASLGGAGGSTGTRTGAGPGMAAAPAAPWEQRPDGGPWEQRSGGGAATGGGRSGAAGTGAPSEPRLGAVRETDTYEEPLGDEVRVIDNRHSATGITRSVKASREWSRTLTVGDDSKHSLGGEAQAGIGWLHAKGTIEAELQRSYSIERSVRHVFEEEITVSVPARTTVRLELKWKRIWQRGFVELFTGDGAVTRVPFQFVSNVTFDQVLRDTDAEPWTAAVVPGGGPASGAAAAAAVEAAPSAAEPGTADAPTRLLAVPPTVEDVS